MVSDFEIAAGAPESTEEGTAVVTASGEVVRQSSAVSPASVIEVPKRRSHKHRTKKVDKERIVTVSEDKKEVAAAVVSSLNASAERIAEE